MGIVLLRLRLTDPRARWRREHQAPPGHLAGHRPRGDQPEGLRGHPHHLHRHHPARHSRVQGGHLQVLRVRPRARPRSCSRSGRPTGDTLDETDHHRLQQRRRPRGRRRDHPGQPEGQPRDRQSSSTPVAEEYFGTMAEPAAAILPGRLVRRLPDVRQLHGRPLRQPARSAATTSARSTTRSSRPSSPRPRPRPTTPSAASCTSEAEALPPQRRDGRASRSTGTSVTRCSARTSWTADSRRWASSCGSGSQSRS